MHFARGSAVRGRLTALLALMTFAVAAQIAALCVLRPLPESAALAVPVYLASLALWGWAVAATRGHGLTLAFSADRPSRLIERGPYRWIRHPFYAAYALYVLAGTVASLSWWVAASAAAFVAACAAAARFEEQKFQASDLAGAYRTYRERTGMFLPRLGVVLARSVLPSDRIQP